MGVLNKCYKASVCDMENEFICDVDVESTGSFITLVFPEGVERSTLEEGLLVTFYDDQRGLVTYKCRLDRYTQRDGGLAANCVLGQEQGSVQRRNDMKIHQHVEICIQTRDSSGRNVTVSGIIKDISAGGIFFISDHPFEVGQTFTFDFNEGDKPLHLECKVLRSQNYTLMAFGVPEEKIGYGCQFVHLHSSSESVIRSYVFKQDALARRRR